MCQIEQAALRLLRYKMVKRVEESDSAFPSIEVKELNDILVTANLPVVTPSEVKAKEVKVIPTAKEET